MALLTGARFCQIGEALYDKRWKAILARMLTRNARMIQFYAKGTTPVPIELQNKLAEICMTKSEALARIAVELNPSLAARGSLPQSMKPLSTR